MSRFQKGQSGNPAGRPKGSLGMAGKLRAAIQADAEQIIQSLIAQAKEGDTTAAKILLDRICPALKPEAQAVELEQLATGSLIEKAEAVLAAVGVGELAPDVAVQLVQSVATLAKVTEIDQLQQRLESLEKLLTKKEM
jgi:(p)ppGpp synthase/HD superfamily hydrolase